ncbi:MAG: glycine cleavage system aminomethyltransferase GcvT [Planctomycetaceae bacterium]|nr:glycine cleavage system aminomethyltransferase GcvT [Planctomycetaceae bacterium]
MLKTPLHDWHVAHGGRMVDFAGWSMPVQYSTITDEHQAVRNAAGLFDISHMGRLRVTGTEAASLVERLVTCRISSLKPGRVRYGLMTNEAGGILDDVLIYALGEGDLAIVVNASNRRKIVSWIESHIGDADVAFADDTLQLGMIALQGPRAAELLSSHVDIDLSKLGYYRCLNATVFDLSALVSRTGYTGEDGFEFILPAELAPGLWERLMSLGGGSVTACGLGCRDTLRLEAAMPLYGHELRESIDPITAGLSFAVALDKNFIGRDAIKQVAEHGPEKVRVGLRLAGKRIAREGTSILAGEKTVGEVTSGTFAPTLQASIAMGYVFSQFAESGTTLDVDLRGKRESTAVVPLPFYRRA